MSITTTSPIALPVTQPKPRSRIRIWFKRGFFGLTVAIVSLAGIGAIYQAIASGLDARRFLPPGKMVDIGGRRIHMVVVGNKTDQPTVILEAGMASFSSNFYWVQNELAATTQVVAYDRAGLGWSDPAPEPQDAQQSARDLHAALQAADIQGPFVVAGHSYGGLVVRAFTDLYPDEVAGMVLIDASHPNQWAHMPVSRDGKVNAQSMILSGILARFGVVRFFHLEKSLTAGLPERSAGEMQAILAQPQPWKVGGEVLMLWSERTRPQINQALSLGDLPLAVISVTNQPYFADILTSLQADLATLSSNSIHYTEAGATHESLVAEQEHALIVVDIIRQVLEAARTGQALVNMSR